jgi:exodeoxyribonuclease V alpha subunit
MSQMGLAKQTFLELYHHSPWLEKDVANQWPFLNLLLAQHRLKDLDYSLIKHLLRDHPQASQEVALFIYYLILAAKEGHLCVNVSSQKMNPSIKHIWQNEDDYLLTLEEEKFLTQAVKQGSQQIPSQLLTICSLKNPMPVTPLCQEGDDFYLQRHWMFETLFLKYFKVHLNRTPTLSLEFTQVNQAVQVLEEKKVLLKEQAEAIRQGCSNTISMIIGGPGTGKTYTAGHLIQIFLQQLTVKQRESCQIILAAPTGKAAANLQRSLTKVGANNSDFPPIQAKTLHALLGIKSKGRQTDSIRLSADLILVDESSMIDVRLMARLFEALKPGSRLVLLGDPYQLPSVEAGSLFADLIQLKYKYPELNIPLTRLNVCLRAELHSLIEFAQLINEGQAAHVLNYLNSNQRKGIKRLFLPEGKKEAQRALIDYVLSDFPGPLKIIPSSEELLHAFNKLRILSPIRKGPLGAETLNQLIWERISQQSYAGNWIAIPIMISTNDYRQELFNGETGVLVRRLPLQMLGVEDYALFPSRHTEEEVRRISALLLPHYDYAYCLSVHKSQGSEFDRVILVLPEGAELFGREVVYTAVTRARQQIEIYGSDLIIEKTVKQQGLRLSGVEKRFLA